MILTNEEIQTLVDKGYLEEHSTFGYEGSRRYFFFERNRKFYRLKNEQDELELIEGLYYTFDRIAEITMSTYKGKFDGRLFLTLGTRQERLKLLHECLTDCVENVNEIVAGYDLVCFTAEIMRSRIVGCFHSFLDTLITVNGIKFTVWQNWQLLFYRWPANKYDADEAPAVTATAEEFIESVEKYIELYISILKISWLKDEILSIEINQMLQPSTELGGHKLKWKGTVGQFGLIIDALIKGDYLEKPAATYTKSAALLMQHFDIDTTPQCLEKEISERSNSLVRKNRNSIVIPHRDHLK